MPRTARRYTLQLTYSAASQAAGWFVAAVYALEAMAFVLRASRVWRDPFAPQSQGWDPGLHSARPVGR